MLLHSFQMATHPLYARSSSLGRNMSSHQHLWLIDTTNSQNIPQLSQLTSITEQHGRVIASCPHETSRLNNEVQSSTYHELALPGHTTVPRSAHGAFRRLIENEGLEQRTEDSRSTGHIRNMSPSRMKWDLVTRKWGPRVCANRRILSD